MKNFLPLGLSLVAALGFLAPVSLSAQIVNIDFLGFRAGDAGNPPVNFTGQAGAAGGGEVFNPVVADDTTLIPNPTNAPVGSMGPGTPTDNITVSGSNFLDSYGTATNVGFTIGPVGADSQNGNLFFGVFNGSYLFINSANNVAGSVPFSITGLGTATTATVYFYTTNLSGLNDPAITFVGAGATEVTYPSTTAYTDTFTLEFTNVPVVAGTITGAYASDHTEILSGLTVDVPEPSTWVLMALGAGFLLWRLRRRDALA